MTISTTPENSSEAICGDSTLPQTVVMPALTSHTEPVPKFPEEEVEDDMPMLVFDWIDNNANIFLQRWEARNEPVSQLQPSFNLYGLLLTELTRDIDVASEIGKGCIQCASNIAYGNVTNRMGVFEFQPWVTTIIAGKLPGCGKLANLFVKTSVHKSTGKPLKVHGELF